MAEKVDVEQQSFANSTLCIVNVNVVNVGQD